MSEAAAQEHYEGTGRPKGHFPRLPRLFLQYTACRSLYGAIDDAYDCCAFAPKPATVITVMARIIISINIIITIIVQRPHLDHHIYVPQLSTEQFYSHLPAWAVALRVGAEVVLPPALVKDGQGAWQPAPTDVLLNTTAMKLAGSMLGVTMHKVPAHLDFPCTF